MVGLKLFLLNQTNGNPYDGITGRLKLLVEPSEDLSIKLTYWHQDSEQKFANRLTYPNPPAIDNTFGETYSDFTIYVADIEYDLGFATLQSTTGYMENTVISNNGGFDSIVSDFTLSQYDEITTSHNGFLTMAVEYGLFIVLIIFLSPH